MRNFYVLMIAFLCLATNSSAQNITLQSGYNYPGNIGYIPYQRTVFNFANSIGVMGLTVNDAGGDALPTTISRLSFSISALSSNAIYMAAIYYGGTRIDTCSVINGATNISFNHGSFPQVSDGGTLNLELRLLFKTTVTDNQQMQFSVSSVTALTGGSLFTAADGGGAASPVSGNINKISVSADRFKFIQQPTNTFAGQIISPSVSVKAVDKNNNTDADYVTPVKLDITNSIPSCDTLAGNLVTPVSGIATFSALTPNVADFYVMLTTVSALTNVVSNSFDVNSAQIKTLINWNFTDNNAIADGGTNSNYNTKTISTTSTGTIAYGSCGCIGDRAPGAYSTGWEAGSGNKYWQIDFSSLGYWNLKVSARQRSSATGPANFKVQYKINSGGVWQNIVTLSTLADSFKTNSVTIPELDTASHIYIRWVMSSNNSISGSPVDNAGESFIDDISVSGTSITLAKQLNYRSKSSGDFESSCNWESTDSIGRPWKQAHGAPDFTAFGIQIQPGHTIVINQTVRVDQVVVDAGATLVLDKGQLYISGGGSVAGTSGLIVRGTFIDNTSGSNVGLSFNSGNSWKLDSAATFIKTGNSNPRIYRDFFYNGMSTIPSTAKWIIRYTGGSSPAFTTDSTFYPNLTFESTSGNWNPGSTAGSYFSGTTADGAFATVKGNLDIGGTESGSVKISNVSPNAQPMLVLGNVIVRPGSEFNNIVNSTFGTGIEIKGNLITEGTLTVNSGSTGILKMSGSALQTLSGSGTISIRNLTIDNSGTGVSITRNLAVGGIDSLISGILDHGINTLTLSGDVVRIAGSINAKSGTIVFDGASSQTIPANTFLNNTLKNLTIANDVSLDGQDSITGTLTLTGNNNVLTTNGNLTLKSTAAGTANVAKINNGNSIAGDVIVERYISSKRAWRFLSIPTNTIQTVKQAWQEGALNSAHNPVPGYGTQVTNKSSAWEANGFDYNSPDGPAIKKFNPANGSWTGIPNTNNLPAGTGLIKTNEGLMTFVRGDRRSSGLGATVYPTVLRTKGPLYIGVQPAITVNPGKTVSIGNPYASALDLRKLSKSAGISETFIVWDPYLNNTNGTGLGAFQYLFKSDGGDYIALLQGGSYASGAANSNYIESGQAFFAQSIAGGTITIDENAKADAYTGASVLRSSSKPRQRLRTNLYAIEPDGSAALIDATLNDFGETYSNAIDNLDAIKVLNFAENLSTKCEDITLAIQRRNKITANDTILLNLMNLKVRAYQFEITGNDFTRTGLTAFLEDSYLNTSTIIDFNGKTKVDFNVIDVDGSLNPDRFSIVFKTTVSEKLPEILTPVKATRLNKAILIEWKVNNEKNIKQYLVERSVNGVQFNQAISIVANNGNSNIANYQWTDVNVAGLNNYYRIKYIDVSGKAQYSNTVKVIMDKNNTEIAVYPNPVINGAINLLFVDQPKGTYVLKLTNNAGQVIQVKQIQHTEGDNTETMQLINSAPKGIYHLEVIKPGNNKTAINVLYK